MRCRVLVALFVGLGFSGALAFPAPSRAASDVLTVVSTADTSSCPGITTGDEPSLRCAIVDANADADSNPVVVNFDIPSSDPNCSATSGVCIISPTSTLPAVQRANVTVDGYGQPGPSTICASPPCQARPNSNSFSQSDNAAILIQLDGSAAPVGTNGLQLSGNGDAVEGLSITHFDSDSSGNGGIGVSVGSATVSDTVEGDFIGLTPNGSTAGDAIGVSIVGASTVGGSTPTDTNVINGSQGYAAQAASTTDAAEGIQVTGTGGVVEGNLVGIDPSGNAANPAREGRSPRASAQGSIPGPVGGGGKAGDTTLSRPPGGKDRIVGTVAPLAVPKQPTRILLPGLPKQAGMSRTAWTARAALRLRRMAATAARVLTSRFHMPRPAPAAPDGRTSLAPTPLAAEARPLESGRTRHPGGVVLRRRIVASEGWGRAHAVSGYGRASGGLSYDAPPIGPDANPPLPIGANDSGIEVHDATDVSIGPENVVSGNPGAGIAMCDTAGSSVAGNLIGTDVTGTEAVGNGGEGIVLADNCFSNVSGASQNDIIGGATASDRNVIAGNGTAAPSGSVYVSVEIDSFRDALSGTAVQGNFIGTDVTGAKALPNGGGVWLNADGASLGGIAIGGTSAGDGNVISGNSAGGIYLNKNNEAVFVNNVPLTVHDSTIEGNFVGVDATGEAALGNGSDGIAAGLYTSNITIGAPGAGNVISGNGFGGIDSQIETGMVIQSNDIGVAVDGHTDVGNGGTGVSITGAVLNNVNVPGSDNTIGGTGAGDGNVIAYNGGNGVNVGAGSSDHTQVAIEENSIYANMTDDFVLQSGPAVLGGLEGEIQLSQWFPSSPPCSTASSSTAPNDYTPCPIITGQTSDGADVASISGTACTGCRVEVFTATNGFYDSEQGGGQIYLGAVTAGETCTSCASGFSGWSISSSDFAGGFLVPLGQPVTATATQQVPGSSPAQYETSEFAQDYAQTSAPDFVVTTTSDSAEGLPCDDPITGQFIAAITLRCGLAETDFATAPTVTFDIPTSGPTADPGCSDMTIQGGSVPVCEIEPLFPLPNISTDDVTVDGTSQPGWQPNTNPVGKPDNTVLTIWIDGSDYLALAQAASSGAGLNGGYFNLLETTSSGDVFKGLALTNGVTDAISGYIDTTVQGDLIGATPTGASAPASYIFASATDFYSSTYGGAEPADRNVIDGGGAGDPSNADGDGIYSNEGGDIIQGSYIGVDPTGTTAYPNLGAGIEIGGAAPGGQIGGSSAADGNVISGTQTGATDNGATTTDAAGILVDSGSATTGLQIEGDYIGTNAAGTSAIPNGAAGIHIEASGDVVVGGKAAGDGNLVSGNTGPGIQIDGGTPANEIQGNIIGLNADGKALGNDGDGVLVDQGTTGDEVGGEATGADNTIVDNGGNGVTVGSSATDENHVAIDPNLIHDNTGPPIELTGQTDCTSGLDTSGRPNDYTPCPTGVTVAGTAGNATAQGYTCPGCLVEAFLAGTRGGTEFLGSTTAGTCSSPPCSGNSQPFIISGLNVSSGQQVTFTATQQTTGSGSPVPFETSEYSAPQTPTATLVSGFRVAHRGGWLIFRWRLVVRSGVAGFRIDAGDKRLTGFLPVHRAGAYVKRLHSRARGPYALLVLLRSGQSETVSSGT